MIKKHDFQSLEIERVLKLRPGEGQTTMGADVRDRPLFYSSHHSEMSSPWQSACTES